VKGSTIGAGTTGSGHTLAPLRGHNGRNIASPPPASTMVPLYTGAIFQVADWHCTGHDDGNHREEWCDAHEVAVTRRGVYSREVGRMHIVADPSTVVFWNDAEAYRIRHPVPGGDDCSIFRFRQGAFREFIASLAPRLSDAETLHFPVAQCSLQGRTYLTHRSAVVAAQALAYGAQEDPLAVEELGLAFLQDVVGFTPRRAVSNRHAREYANRVRIVIGARFKESLSLTQIGESVECSPYHLTRVVRQALGTSIHQLLVRLRLRAALEQLVSTTAGISPIAFDVGFASHSHFSHAFRREFGATPTAVRRAMARRGSRALPGR
jgi:AraC family transcriptional regulator